MPFENSARSQSRVVAPRLWRSCASVAAVPVLASVQPAADVESGTLKLVQVDPTGRCLLRSRRSVVRIHWGAQLN